MKYLISFVVPMIFLAGCLQLNDNGTGKDSSVIFQSEYTNYAWGYNHNGWIMDNTGKVNRFQKKDAWVFPDSLGYISSMDMQKNFGACDSVIAQIPSIDFTRYAAKALTCVNGPLTKARMTMADAGENICCIYIYEADRQRYKRVILNVTGDWSQENLSSNAREVVNWMVTIK
jgi:hypothetical protein